MDRPCIQCGLIGACALNILSMVIDVELLVPYLMFSAMQLMRLTKIIHYPIAGQWMSDAS